MEINAWTSAFAASAESDCLVGRIWQYTLLADESYLWRITVLNGTVGETAG